MANVKFGKVTAGSYTSPAERWAQDSTLTKDASTFYAVGSELYLGDVLLSATTASEIAVVDAGVITAVDVEAALNELYHDQAAQKIWFVDATPPSGSEYAAVYEFYRGENAPDAVTDPATKIGTINIPKDMFVEDGSVVDITYNDSDGKLYDGVTDVTDLIIPSGGTATADDAGKYIKLVLENVTNPLYIAAKDLVDIYTGGDTAEVSVSVDSSTNEITATIVKIAATKVIYQEDAEAVYEADATVDASNFDDKVAAGLYTTDGTTYTKVAAGATFDPSETYYVQASPALSEINIKAKVDQVEADLIALDNYVGDIPGTSEATTVIGYVDEKTGEGVGALNSEAGIASKSGDVVTIKGGIVETSGLIDNSVSTPPSTSVDVYINPADGKFYEESTYDTEVTPASNTAYVDQNGGGIFVWTGKAYSLVRPDIVFEEVAVTGDSADVFYDNTVSGLTADDVQEAIDEIAGTLTWNEV